MRMPRWMFVVAIAVAAMGLAGQPSLGATHVGQASTRAAGPRFATIYINFESDPTGSKPDGWTSADSPLVHFYDSMGSDLDVANTEPESHGNEIRVFSDDPGYLQIHIEGVGCGISMSFGNDDPSYSNPGDMAVLTTFRGTTRVAQASVEMNRNDVMDQRIGVTGERFNRATFLYDVTTVGLIEIVDDIVIKTC